YLFFFSSRRRHMRFSRDWSSDECSSDLEVYMREALEIRRRQLPPHDPLLSTTLDMFGVVLNRRGAYTDAESMYRDALAIRREIHQEPHIEVATTLNNLAVNLFDQGQDRKST